MNRSQQKRLDIGALHDKKISVALMAPPVVLTIQYLILVSMDLTGMSMGGSIQLLSKLLVAILFAHALPVVFKRNKVRIIRTYFVWVFIFLLHYLVFPENRMYQSELVFPFFLMCLPAFIYSSTVRDWKILREIMIKASYVVFSAGALLGFLVVSGKASVGSYSMPLSYYLLLPTLMFINEFLDIASFKSIVLALISFCLILVLGARGPIICTGAFILLRLLRPPRKLRYSEIIVSLPLAAATIVMALCFEDLLMYMQGFLLKLGLRSRSILLFLRPEVHLGGRDRYYSEVVAQIIDRPFAGIGIAGDRYILGGSYVHNIFIEILANYGIVIGMLVIFGLLILLFRFCFCKSKQQYEMFAMWVSIGFIPLLVSGSYLTDMNFWIFIGLMTSGLRVRGNSRHNIGEDQENLI